MILFSGHRTSLLISAARGHDQADQTWDRTVLEQSSAPPAGHPFCLNYFGVVLSHLCGLRILPCVFFSDAAASWVQSVESQFATAAHGVALALSSFNAILKREPRRSRCLLPSLLSRLPFHFLCCRCRTRQLR